MGPWGTDTYTGATTINGGTLFVDSPGSILNSTTTINTSGVLAGTGSTGPVLIAGGTLKPGDSTPGTLTSTSVTFTSGTIDLQLPGLGTAGINYDQLMLTSELTLDPSTSALTLDLSGLATTGDFSSVILDSAGIMGSFGDTNSNGILNSANILNNPNNWNVFVDDSLEASGKISIDVFSAASQLVFTTPPSTTTVGVAIAPLVQVSVEDSFGTVIPTNTDQLSVAVATGPVGGAFTVSSILTATAVNGVATFSSLALTIGGTSTLSVSDATPPDTALIGTSNSIVVNAPDLTIAKAANGTFPLSGSGWTLTTVVDATTGQIGIELSSQTPIADATAGSLVTITFHVRANVTAAQTAVELVASVNPNGSGVVHTALNDSLGGFVLTPAPVNGPGGVVGLVTIKTPPAASVAPRLPVLGSGVLPAALTGVTASALVPGNGNVTPVVHPPAGPAQQASSVAAPAVAVAKPATAAPATGSTTQAKSVNEQLNDILNAFLNATKSLLSSAK